MLKKLRSVIKNNKALFGFMGISYIDKAIIFLLPLLILQLFKDDTLYLSVEYIYSLTIVIVPFLDFGLTGYFYYIYRNQSDKDKTVDQINRIFHVIYTILGALGLLLIVCHYTIIPIDEYIIYIVARSLFLVTLAFFSSYYRLINKPQNAIYVSIVANVVSLGVLIVFAIFDLAFKLWLVFIGQILFCTYYFIKISYALLLKWKSKYSSIAVLKTLKASLLYSWPTILQVFVMMFIANFGKITALDDMTVDDGVLLSLTQRISMVIFLTHSSLLAFFVKSVYNEEQLLGVNKRVLKKYLGVLLLSTLFVSAATGIYLMLNYDSDAILRPVFIAFLIICYTLMSCIIAYLEMHYGRENKNIIKLYLALFLGILFTLALKLLDYNLLEKITIAMFISTFVVLITSITVLYKRGYRFT